MLHREASGADALEHMAAEENTFLIRMPRILPVALFKCVLECIEQGIFFARRDCARIEQ